MSRFHNHVVAAVLPLFLLCAPAGAVDREKLDGLFTRLKDAEEGPAGRIAAEIRIEWAKSGSPAMDLLLQRAGDALELGNTDAAIEHLTAALDHAPDFTEARAARAWAYFSAGLVGPAISDLGQVLEEEPRHFDALALLATILEETDHRAKALAAWRAGTDIHPWLEEAKDAITRLETELEGQEL